MAEPEPGPVRVARALLEAGTIHARLDDPVTFRSGLRSPVYVDNRRLTFHPRAWHVIIEAFQASLPSGPGAPEVVAGVEAAGIPHSSALAFAAGLPTVFVRKEAKGHGLGQRIEGGDVRGRRVLLVEDLITTGGSSLSAVAALREAGAQVTRCLAIISYGFEEAAVAFETSGVELRSLTSFAVLLDEAAASGAMSLPEADAVRDWLADPRGWATEHAAGAAHGRTVA